MWARVKKWLLGLSVGAAVIAGCTGLNAVLPPPPAVTNGYTEVYGTRVYYQPDVLLPLSPADLKRAFEAAAKYWDTEPSSMQGWVVVQRGNDPWSVEDMWVWGVSFMDIKRLDFATMRPDCPQMVFLHEWGHAGASILGHDDERFDDNRIHAFLVTEGICRS
jgi:hypothetical protein